MPSSGAWYPYYLVDRITFGSDGIATLQLDIGQSEEFEGDEIDFVVSSGNFNIISIQDQGGKGYSNADASNPLPSTFFLSALDQRTFIHQFATPLVLLAQSGIRIQLTGGTNGATVDCCIKGRKRAL